MSVGPNAVRRLPTIIQSVLFLDTKLGKCGSCRICMVQQAEAGLHTCTCGCQVHKLSIIPFVISSYSIVENREGIGTNEAGRGLGTRRTGRGLGRTGCGLGTSQ